MATKKLDELNQSENIFNDDIMLVQHKDGAAETFTGLQMKKFCTEGFTSDEETLNTLNPSSNKPINSGAIGNAGFGVYKTAVCSSAADAEEKAIIIQNYIPVNGDVIGITFENGNTYGETTISNPTNPKIKINDSALFSICDSRGHAAGKGFCNSGDYIEFRIVGDKLIILNSDIRESVQGESGYTIYSNNFIEQWVIRTSTLAIWNFPIAFKDSNYIFTGNPITNTASSGTFSISYKSKTNKSVYIDIRQNGTNTSMQYNIKVEGYL